MKIPKELIKEYVKSEKFTITTGRVWTPHIFSSQIASNCKNAVGYQCSENIKNAVASTLHENKISAVL